jgi:hypothetical protein
MKKEYFILIALIVIFSAYIVFHKDNRANYNLPVIGKTDTSKITRLMVTKNGKTIEFSKKNKIWTLTDKAFKADETAVENMLDTFRSFRLSALVSDRGDLKRYELDKQHAIHVTAFNGTAKVFDFSMGKTAPSYNHTFVTLKGDKNIYHAKGNFRSYFDKSVDDFRDKTVVQFKKNDIKQFSIEKGRVSKIFTAHKKKGSKNQIQWLAKDGRAVDSQAVSDLLDAVSFLDCETYPDSPSKKELEGKTPLCHIRLKGKKPIELKLYKGTEKDSFNGLSSMSDYVFTLSLYNGNQILSNADKLLGITKKKK